MVGRLAFFVCQWESEINFNCEVHRFISCINPSQKISSSPRDSFPSLIVARNEEREGER